MKVYTSTADFPDPSSTILALGNFDGVHLGHQKLLSKALSLRAQSKAAGKPCEAGVLTFWPHPAEVLSPKRAPKRVQTKAQRLQAIDSMGFDFVVAQDFTLQLAQTSPEAFVEKMLIGDLHARHVVVGENFNFGRGGKGTPALLSESLPRFGALVHVCKLQQADGSTLSSTRIRSLISDGQVSFAWEHLGRPFALEAKVVSGDGRGRSLGFRTANLDIGAQQILPQAGVYATRTFCMGQELDSITNVGVRPTFGESSLQVECHLLDTSMDLYGERIEVRFIRRVRDERRFASREDLIAQIQNDIAIARRIHSESRHEFLA